MAIQTKVFSVADLVLLLEEYKAGMIAAVSGQRGLVVTINGSYVQGWEMQVSQGGRRRWVVAYLRSGHSDLWNTTAAQAMDLCKEFLQAIDEGTIGREIP